MSHKDLISMHELYGFNVNEGEMHRIDKMKKREGSCEWMESFYFEKENSRGEFPLIVS